MKIKFPPIALPFDQPGVVDGKGSRLIVVFEEADGDILAEHFSDMPEGEFHEIPIEIIRVAKRQHGKRTTPRK